MHSRWEEAPAFGVLLAEIIRLTGLSQRELADLAGVSHSQVSRWKAGSHQPGYGAMLRLGAGLRESHPELGDLAPRLARLAGYPAPGVLAANDRGIPADAPVCTFENDVLSASVSEVAKSELIRAHRLNGHRGCTPLAEPKPGIVRAGSLRVSSG